MALLEFRSKAAAGFYMMPDTFRSACRVMGREYSEQGCLLSGDLQALIEKLTEEIAREKVLLAELQAKKAQREREGKGFLSYEEEEAQAEEERKALERVPMSVRFFPLLEMMQLAQKMHQNVMWGVP